MTIGEIIFMFGSIIFASVIAECLVEKILKHRYENTEITEEQEMNEKGVNDMAEHERPKVTIVGGGRSGGKTAFLHKALWDELYEYKTIGTVEEIKSFFNENRKAGYKHGYADGYAKAIDDFMKQVEFEYDNDACPNVTDWNDYKISIRDLFKIAEQLRGDE